MLYVQLRRNLPLSSTCNSTHAHQHYEDLQKQLDLPRHTGACSFVLAGVDLWCRSPWRQCQADRVTHILAEAPLMPSHVVAHSAVTERSVLQLPPSCGNTGSPCEPANIYLTLSLLWDGPTPNQSINTVKLGGKKRKSHFYSAHHKIQSI